MGRHRLSESIETARHCRNKLAFSKRLQAVFGHGPHWSAYASHCGRDGGPEYARHRLLFLAQSHNVSKERTSAGRCWFSGRPSIGEGGEFGFDVLDVDDGGIEVGGATSRLTVAPRGRLAVH